METQDTSTTSDLTSLAHKLSLIAQKLALELEAHQEAHQREYQVESEPETVIYLD